MIALLVVALAVAVLTWIAGWGAVPLVAVVAGAVHCRRRGISWLIALASAGAWGALVLVDAVPGRVPALVAALGGLLKIPGALLIVVTLLFAALLAWSAAVIGAELGRFVRRDAPLAGGR
jgi:hypothetical protein